RAVRGGAAGLAVRPRSGRAALDPVRAAGVSRGADASLGPWYHSSGGGARMSLKLVIDGSPVEVANGATVLDAVNQLGLPLPQLSRDPARPPLGACRTCLVHVEGGRGFPAACHLPAREGMVVHTRHPEATRLRRAVLDLTLSMLTTGDGRDSFGQVGEAAQRHA